MYHTGYGNVIRDGSSVPVRVITEWADTSLGWEFESIYAETQPPAESADVDLTDAEIDFFVEQHRSQIE